MSDFKPRFLKPSESSSFLDRTELSFSENTNFIFNRNISQSIQTQRQRLPIFKNRNHILYLIEKYQILVLVGETGCGKSTQIPQYLVEAEWPKMIGVCEPRRVAAVSLANRVAEEMDEILQSNVVGYAVKFDGCTNNPKIKFMTEGILIREMMADPLLTKYSVVMLDEVHERTLYTDILMGLIKKILKKRQDLKLIIASATMDANNLFEFFNSKQDGKNSTFIINVEGRVHAVDIYYIKEPVPCYVQATVDTILKINVSKETGDILAFLTGQEEVEKAVRLLNEHATLIEMSNKKELMLVLPMYASLPFHDQLKVFKAPPKDHRKVVISTNVAETSITIPGIAYVIDCGFVKMRWYNYSTHTDSLLLMPISKASSRQRAGRAGRMRSGKCYRLYTQEDAQKLSDETPPEMVRTNLAYTILQLKALGIRNILKFKFPTPPPIENLRSALEILYALDAIDIRGELTRPLGFNMAEFALDPLYSKLLLSSEQFGCSEEILTIIAMLQVETIFTKPASGNMAVKARIQKRKFEVNEGDLLTNLNVYQAYISNDKQKEFCHRYFINYKSMQRVVEIRKRLEKTLQNYNVSLLSCNGYAPTVCKSLVSGLFPNAAYLHHSGVYKTVRGDIELYVHPDSALYTIVQPQWVLFCEVLNTTKLYMKDITVIEKDWLLEIAPHFYHKTTHRD